MHRPQAIRQKTDTFREFESSKDLVFEDFSGQTPVRIQRQAANSEKRLPLAILGVWQSAWASTPRLRHGPTGNPQAPRTRTRPSRCGRSRPSH